MGLCKCPKRQVTNQFCVEHRVNVCEYCMIQSHSKCIVQSYLQWLRDSDYISNCTLCGFSLDNSECVRLVCYHVFHWNCLSIRQASISNHTTPRGHKCPICDTEILPTANLISPVADVLKTYLLKTNWGRNGLGLDLLIDDSEACSTGLKLKSSKELGITPKNQHSVLLMDTFNASSSNIYASSRRALLPRKSHIGSTDCDENKYKRRTPAELFSIWSHRFYVPSRRLLWRRPFILILVGILSLSFIIYVISNLKRSSANDDSANEWINQNLVPSVHYE